MTERESIFMIHCLERMGCVTYDRLLALYGSAKELWMDPNPPITGKMLLEWQRWHRTEYEKIRLAEWKALEKAPYRFVIREDDDYPERLLQIPDPPVGLFLMGEVPKSGDGAAIVGARAATPYGRETARRLGRELAEQGVIIVSGMAAGIDAAGHWGALEAGGCTIAVLGCGIDICFPAENCSLFENLKERGVILSEYPPGMPGRAYHFPMRNRLISGLSRVVTVVEARARSGSLITADRALEQGRDVMAVPGRIGDPLSAGCLQLLRQGAGIVTGTSDILRALGRGVPEDDELESVSAGSTSMLTGPEVRVYETLTGEPLHQDLIAGRSGIPLSELFDILWKLESRGLIRQASVGTYMKKG